MNRERDLLRKILDKTNYINYACNDKIRNEIMEFLFQPEQEPVAWIDGGIGGGTAVGWYDKDIIDLPKGTKLYTHPPKREPLSDETICEILLKKEWKGFVELVRQVEILHGIGVE